MNAYGRTSSGRAADKVACRLIEPLDVPAVIRLLAEGFPERNRAYWERAFERLGQRAPAATFPRYGYLLSVGDSIVGCILLIVSMDDAGDLRANVSSWYVQPAFRSLASMLVSFVFRQKDLTLINISPAPHTVPILEAQGYIRFVDGQVIAVPALAPVGINAPVIEVRPDGNDPGLLPAAEMALLARHASWGCYAFICCSEDGNRPFVFVKGWPLRGIVPAAQLVWCRDVADVSRFAGVIGRHLLRRGMIAVCVDAAGPISGLRGRYREGRAPKFFRGPNRPRLGDLADTELAIFGA